MFSNEASQAIFVTPDVEVIPFGFSEYFVHELSSDMHKNADAATKSPVVNIFLITWVQIINDGVIISSQFRQIACKLSKRHKGKELHRLSNATIPMGRSPI